MEGRRRRQLTPLSGELRAPEWAPAPVEKPRRERKPKAVPKTRAGMILFGLRRFAVIALGVVSGTLLVGLTVVWLSDSHAAHTLPRTFYFAGAAFAAVTFLGGTGMYSRWYRSRSEQEFAVNASFVYGMIAVILIGIGVALEILL
jgi:cation transport ATPase